VKRGGDFTLVFQFYQFYQFAVLYLLGVMLLFSPVLLLFVPRDVLPRSPAFPQGHLLMVGFVCVLVLEALEVFYLSLQNEELGFCRRPWSEHRV
jgi:hypothetical protein